MMFNCKRCGLCCQHVNLSPLYEALDRGDGVCRYLVDSLCSIYEARPLLCRIDESYDVFFKGFISKEDYYRLNYEACNKMEHL